MASLNNPSQIVILWFGL